MLTTLIDGAAHYLAGRFNPQRAQRPGDPVQPSGGGLGGSEAASSQRRRALLRQYPARNNSAFDAVTNFLVRGVSELTPGLGDPADPKAEPLLVHPLLDLWRAPNPYHTTFHMVSAVIKNAADTGHSFILLGTNASDRIDGLYYAPSQAMQMLVDAETGAGWPVGWRFFHGGIAGRGASVDIPAYRVIHIQWEIDPLNTRASRGAGATLALDVVADSLSRDWTATQMDNGIAGVGIALGGLDVRAKDAAEKAKEFQQQLGGGNRGENVVVPQGSSFSRIGATARDLEMRSLSRLPEERISSVLGVPAMAVGLGAGLDRSTFTNYREALRAGFENGVIPIARLLAEAVTRQLLWQPDFDPQRRYRFVFDHSELAVLQEAQGELSARIVSQWTAGLIDRAKALEELGYEPAAEDAGVYAGPSAEPLFLSAPAAPLRLTGPAPRRWSAADREPSRRYTPAEDLRDALLRLHAARTRELDAPLRRLLIAAAERAVSQAAAAVAATGAVPEAAALYASFADDMAALTLPAAEVTAEGVAAAINASGVLPEQVTLTDAMRILVRERATARTLEMQGTRIGQWNAVVRDRIGLGWTPDQIIEGGGPLPPELEGLKRPGLREILGEEDYRNQARTIARTETTYAQAESATQAYAEAGVRRVLISDGTDWDAECAAANGQTWTVEFYASNPSAHPNCTRTASPIIDG